MGTKSNGATCPNCMREWLWDWCQDAYRYKDGEFVVTGVHIHNREDQMEEKEITLFICKCGSVNSTMLFINGETMMTYVEVWKGVDWDIAAYEEKIPISFKPVAGNSYMWHGGKYGTSVRLFIAAITMEHVITEVRRPEELKGNCDNFTFEDWDKFVQSGAIKKL